MHPFFRVTLFILYAHLRVKNNKTTYAGYQATGATKLSRIPFDFSEHPRMPETTGFDWQFAQA